MATSCGVLTFDLFAGRFVNDQESKARYYNQYLFHLQLFLFLANASEFGVKTVRSFWIC